MVGEHSRDTGMTGGSGRRLPNAGGSVNGKPSARGRREGSTRSRLFRFRCPGRLGRVPMPGVSASGVPASSRLRLRFRPKEGHEFAHDISRPPRLLSPRSWWHSRWQFGRQRASISGRVNQTRRTLHIRTNLLTMRGASHIISLGPSPVGSHPMALLSRVFWVRLPAGSPHIFRDPDRVQPSLQHRWCHSQAAPDPSPRPCGPVITGAGHPSLDT